jgi:hypothetical protein
MRHVPLVSRGNALFQTGVLVYAENQLDKSVSMSIWCRYSTQCQIAEMPCGVTTKAQSAQERTYILQADKPFNMRLLESALIAGLPSDRPLSWKRQGRETFATHGS